MSTKKKKPARRPPRLTSFERAFQDATNRLEARTKRRTMCLQELDELRVEIPYLEGIVYALTPPSPTKDLPPGYTPPAEAAHPTPQQEAPSSPAPTDQEAFLARFMPRTGRVTRRTPPGPAEPLSPTSDATGNDLDEFLSDDRGTEILS